MDTQQINQILLDTAYVRVGGTPNELKCAKYLQQKCAEMDLETYIESFEVNASDILEAKLYVNGKEIACTGYINAGNGEVEAELYYLTNPDIYSLKQCKDKIVMIDTKMGYWMYRDIVENGAVGFITYDGNANYDNHDIDQKELRIDSSEQNKIPGVNINVKNAVEIIRCGAKTAKIILKQKLYKTESHNVLLDLPGELDEWFVLSAHYDSTSLSTGAYDNMSGCIGLLYIAEYFAKEPHRYGLRFLWCGSEEKGLLGSKAYCERNEKELHKVVLNINLDMLGCIMGRFVSWSSVDEKLTHYLEYFAAENGFSAETKFDVRSSDSASFADKGVPAISFARYAPGNTATIHNRYDTLKVISAEQLLDDMNFIIAFVKRMVNAKQCPISREISQKIKEDLDVYMCRIRQKQ